jgi:uncharacterized protein (TIGR02246 family)
LLLNVFAYLSLKLFMKLPLLALTLLLTAGALAQDRDEAAIRALLHTQTEAWNKGDLEAFMQTYWNSDSLQFIGRNGITRGWQQTLANYKRTYPNKAAMGTLTFDIIHIKRLSNDYYHITGKWMLQRAADAPSGYYTLLLHRIAGAWKIVSDHSS